MPPNTIELPITQDPEVIIENEKPEVTPPQVPPPPPLFKVDDDAYKLILFQSGINQLAHILIGATVGICIFFAFRNGLPLGATPLHIVLCVIGYHLLMAQAILSLTSENGWSSRLKLVHKRRAHWMLQILGSGLAIGGSFHKILDKTTHWTTYHGQFGLVALVFTTVCLVNGLASLYAHELRKFLPGNITKILHICFGTVAFTFSSLTLIYGIDKSMFRTFFTDSLAHTAIAFVACSTFIIIINPLITFFSKSKSLLKKQ